MGKKLTDKELLFIKYYPISYNGTKSAIKAGYSKKTARQIATNLLSKVYIQKEIKKSLNKITDKLELTQEKVIQELMKVGFSDVKNYIDIGPKGIKIKELKDIDTKALGAASMKISKGSLNIDFKLHNKEKALELLGRHLGTFNEGNKFEVDWKNVKIIRPNISFKKKDG